MTAPIQRFVFRGKHHIAREIGHVHFQVITRCDVILQKRTIQIDVLPINGSDSYRFISSSIGAGAGDDQTITNSPSLWNVLQNNSLITSTQLISSREC